MPPLSAIDAVRTATQASPDSFLILAADGEGHVAGLLSTAAMPVIHRVDRPCPLWWAASRTFFKHASRNRRLWSHAGGIAAPIRERLA
jgi:hypothetical protein